MGIDLYVFNFLLGFRGRNLGDALCVGRQGFHVTNNPQQRAAAETLFDRARPGVRLDALTSQDGYSEKFLRYLGAKNVRSIDFSSYEDVDIIHDLNKASSR